MTHMEAQHRRIGKVHGMNAKGSHKGRGKSCGASTWNFKDEEIFNEFEDLIQKARLGRFADMNDEQLRLEVEKSATKTDYPLEWETLPPLIFNRLRREWIRQRLMQEVKHVASHTGRR
ncbi:MAG: hypothetical protein SO360_01920 [Bifidobacterium tsurumiense]|uniref:hypothetical protein n=1 Tax=Bifidobacterium tsurumiense TaxID=356829 RepID=UPI002A8299E1|nr:hypothetical protein [Bifidobacterium tsurumiense]MDY4677610.1 hypothetical protein [Bifidobacterium tsurumiense]